MIIENHAIQVGADTSANFQAGINIQTPQKTERRPTIPKDIRDIASSIFLSNYKIIIIWYLKNKPQKTLFFIFSQNGPNAEDSSNN